VGDDVAPAVVVVVLEEAGASAGGAALLLSSPSEDEPRGAELPAESAQGSSIVTEVAGYADVNCHRDSAIGRLTWYEVRIICRRLVLGNKLSACLKYAVLVFEHQQRLVGASMRQYASASLSTAAAAPSSLRQPINVGLRDLFLFRSELPVTTAAYKLHNLSSTHRQHKAKVSTR
jgi:hypothetical protein